MEVLWQRYAPGVNGRLKQGHYTQAVETKVWLPGGEVPGLSLVESNHSLGREGKGRVGTNDPQRPVAGCVRGCAGSVLVERELAHEGGGALLIFLIVKVMHCNCETKKRRSFRKIKRRK